MAEFSKNEWRAIIHFLFKEGKTPTEAANRLQQHYGASAPDRSTISRWMSRFQCGRTSLEDDPRCGAPITATGEDQVAIVRNLLDEDRRLTFDELQAATGFSRGSLQRIIHDDLEMKKVSARWVPRLLTEEHKIARVHLSTASLQLLEELGERFWRRIITADETPLPHYMPETKRQCMQWISAGEPRPVHARSAPSVGKFQVTVFWDCDGVIHVDYCPPRQTINAAYYSELLQIVHNKLPQVRPGKLHMRPLFLQDNARVHTANLTMAKIRELKWQLLPHPAYSPDLAPSDFHLFGPMKDPLRGVKFDGEKEIRAAVKNVLNSFPKSWFDEGMKKLEKRWNKCIDLEGDYVEK